MKTYSQLSIHEKVNCKGNLENKAVPMGGYGLRNAGLRFDVMAMDLLPTRFNLLRTITEYRAHLFCGQNLFE